MRTVSRKATPSRPREIIVSLAHSDEVPLRLPLGAEAVERLTTAYQRGLDGVAQWAELARSADFTGVATSVRPI